MGEKVCNGCGNHEKEGATISMSAGSWELHEERHSREKRRLWIAIIVAIVMLFASNAYWLYCWNSYDYSSEEIIVEQDAQDGGNANYIGNDGDVLNGVSESDNP